MMNATQTATYKGKTYRVLFLGQTKFGRRAHLQFFDGSRDFWCDASLVSASNGGSRQGHHRHGHVCDACGHDANTCGELDCTCHVCGGMNR